MINMSIHDIVWKRQNKLLHFELTIIKYYYPSHRLFAIAWYDEQTYRYDEQTYRVHTSPIRNTF